MKHFAKILTLGAALVAAPLAYAGTITGSVTMTGTGDSFTGTSFTAPSGVPNSSVTAASGTFLNYVPAGCCTIGPPTVYGFGQLSSFSFSSTNAIVFQVGTSVSNYITFTLSAAPTVVTYIPGTFLNLTATGVFTDTGGDSPTAGTFNLTTTGNGNTTFTLVSNTAATPEPSSLIMLGTGLVSAAGMLVRRRRIV